MPDAPVSPSNAPAAANAGSKDRPRIGPLVWWAGLWTSLFVAGVLSLIAYRQGLVFDALPHLDKLVHFGMGGALAFFLDGVLRRRTLRLVGMGMPLSAVLVLVPAGLEEFLQRFSSNRTSSFGDFAADVAGVAFFVWLSRVVGK